jgi:hypothetical protein
MCDRLDPNCTLFRRRLRDSSFYFAVYYTSLYLVSHFLAPFLLIAILNVFILLAIRRAHDQQKKLTYRQSQQRKTTQMIVVVTAVFGTCNTLPFVLNIWEALRPSLFDPDDVWQPIAFLMLDISNVLVVVNSATTVCLYLIYCRKYRLLWIYYVGRYVFRLSPATLDRFKSPSDEMPPRLNSASFKMNKRKQTVQESTRSDACLLLETTVHLHPNSNSSTYLRASHSSCSHFKKYSSDDLHINRSHSANSTISSNGSPNVEVSLLSAAIS